MKSKKNVRVLFIHDGPLYKDEYDNYYGIHFTNDLIERYLKLGDFVTFLIRVNKIKFENSQNFSLLSSLNFSVIEVPNFKSFSKYFITRYKAKKIISKAILEHDIIVTRLPSGIGNIAVKLAEEYKKPLLSEMVACTRDAYWYHSFKGKLIAYFFFLRQKRIVKNLDYCIYVTNYFLQKRYPINGESINCSNVQITISEDEKVLENRISKIKATNLSSKIILGSIGTISIPYKGHKDVIEAICFLNQKGYNFEYHIVGQGNPRNLEKVIEKEKLSKKIFLRGPLKHKEIFDFIDFIDVYIHPSHTEGLPRAPIEAMSRACPVIGSNAGGTPELLSKNFTFEKKNVSQLIKILSSISDEKLLKEAKRSYLMAQKYEKSSLNLKRDNFYKYFLENQVE